ncbi:hypothetical protein DPMN_055848 [Dreissena polymorpha]|uniref:Uncharacterized protein n=1 Tax=Dreissena polymorpha TaxID=45954 RepID=A0A9D4CQP1_DREPO|nr:hypothetical protein DPMN_055848 [Dreissena polymorpha]
MLVFVAVLGSVVLADGCQSVQVGTYNTKLLFEFNWIIEELKSVTCHKYGTTIGHCRGVSKFECSVEKPFSGFYTMSSNSALTQVTFTIAAFDETRAGEYCCSKESMKEPTCKCIHVAEQVTPAKVSSTGKLWGLNNWAMILTALILSNL